MQTRWGDLAVNDAHIHFFTHNFFQSLGGAAARLPGIQGRSSGGAFHRWMRRGLAEVWATELNKHGVERAAMIASIPGDEASVLAAQAAYPEAVSMRMPWSIRRRRTRRWRAGLKAICLFPAMHRYSLHDARVEPLIEQAAAQRTAVFVHCGVLTVGVRKKLGLPSPFDMRFSNPLDLHPIALRYPRTPFVLPHFGAGFPAGGVDARRPLSQRVSRYFEQ